MIDLKKNLRKEYKLRCDVKDRKKKEIVIIERLLKSDLFREADYIFLYASRSDEFSTKEIAFEAEKLGKETAYPFCENENGEMTFYLSCRDDLKQGMYGIMEPDSSFCRKAEFTKKSLCIVPGITFGKKGERLGYGRGYYDRFLRNFSGKTVALCFEECLCDRIPMEEHDIKINYLITEKEIYKTE